MYSLYINQAIERLRDYFFLQVLFTLPNIGLTPPGTYNPNAHGIDFGPEHQTDAQERAS